VLFASVIVFPVVQCLVSMSQSQDIYSIHLQGCLPHISNEAACFIRNLWGNWKMMQILTLGGILPPAFRPFLHPQNAPKSAFLQKLIIRKIDDTRCQILRHAPNRLSAGASPEIPLGSLQRSPRPLSWIYGAYF